MKHSNVFDSLKLFSPIKKHKKTQCTQKYVQLEWNCAIEPCFRRK